MTSYLSQISINARLRARAAGNQPKLWRRTERSVDCQYPVKGSGASMLVCGKPSFGETYCLDCAPIVYRKPGPADAI